MTVTIGRRELLAALGGAAAAWPLAARAQQPTMPVIGVLGGSSLDALAELRAFRQGLKDVGYVEGENVAVEYRSADNRIDRMPELAEGVAATTLKTRAGPFFLCAQPGLI